MSEEKTETKPSITTEIVKTDNRPEFLKEISKNISAMNKLIVDVQELTSKVSEFERSMMYGHYLVKIKEQFNGKTLEIVKNLMNTGIGFKTDRNPDDPNCKYKDVYSDEIIKNCATQAIMHGLRIHGNEWNILGGNFYATKEGLQRIVRANPNLERKIKETIKGFKQSSESHIWEFKCEYEFKLKGEQEVKDSVNIYVRGKQGNYDIPFDAVMGKAVRKLLKTIYNEMNHGFHLEDADDVDELETVGSLKEPGAKTKISQLAEKK